MRGQWNGLQALFLNDCPYAYYVHCLAHRLQLALVAASREVIPVHQFFSKLNFIVNIIGASCKRNDELQSAQAIEIEHLIALGELETGRGANQIDTLQRPGDTRWSSHYDYVCSMIRLFGATCLVLEDIIEDRSSNFSTRGDADAAHDSLTSFQFVFILHLVKEIMGITNSLCQALQQKSQDIVNAMHLVSNTKSLLLKLREEGWSNLFEIIQLFCERHNIDIPDMNAPYSKKIKGRSRHQQENITLEHHYRIDIFYGAIDSQLQELNNRFSEKAVELIILSSALDPRDGYKFFKIDDICKLAKKFYPEDFTETDIDLLKYQLQHYEVDIPKHPVLRNMSTISELCRGLVETEKSKIYYLIDRLIRLVLILPVSTATTERAFSTMKRVKTQLRNRMGDDFLADYLSVNIEKEIALTFTSDSIIDDFYSLKNRRAQLL